VSSKPFLVSFVLIVAAIAAVSVYVSRSVQKTDRTVTSIISPDGKYKAVRVMLTRAGAQPFCSDTIAIFLAVYPDGFAESERNYAVYAAPCAAPANRAKLPKIEWLAPDALRITVPPEAAASAPARKGLDASLFVHLTFVPVSAAN
jgi:hypothetical protein